MDRKTTEGAIWELDDLLRGSTTSEAAFQAWFEKHPVTFTALGYTACVPHPRITGTNGETYIPDFLCRRANAEWAVFEIKTADTQVLLDQSRRQTFYASFQRCISQCHEYTEALDDPAVLSAVRAAYDIDLHRRPAITIVAGRSAGLDRSQAILQSQRQTIKLYTYDDVRYALDFFRTFNFGHYEQAQGFSLSEVIRIERTPNTVENNWLLDLGGEGERNRVSVFVNPRGFLRLAVVDADGARHDARSAIPLPPTAFGRWHSLTCAIGIGEGFGFLSIELDEQYLADIRILDFPFQLTKPVVLGSDHRANGRSWIGIALLLQVAHPFSLSDRRAFATFARSRIATIEAGDSKDSIVSLLGREAFWSEGHYNASHFEAAFAPAAGFPERWVDYRGEEFSTPLLGGRRR